MDEAKTRVVCLPPDRQIGEAPFNRLNAPHEILESSDREN